RINLAEQRNLTRDDVYQFGVVGLLGALARYDPQNGSSFKTFAYRRIHGEIIDAVRRDGVLSRDQMQKLNTINKTKNALIKTLNREPTYLELEKETGLSLDEISSVISTAKSKLIVSLDEPVFGAENKSMSYYEVLANEDDKSPEKELDETELREELKSLVQGLPERERLILALYYYEELTLADIGTVLGLSEGRVSQILNQVHSDLRQEVKR
ncbi:MAG TPA: FliA/WhiG family RNA polymerase sigma factor, partial [Candidatus Marinimicrobia bacterium]|nr:FliA/WhiG family RNA polymerase sigma factor [Candidatus Neomarinimicrobiota bacterium]